MQRGKWNLKRIRSGIRWRYRKLKRITKYAAGTRLYRTRFRDYEQLYRLSEPWFDFGVAVESQRLGDYPLAEIKNPKKEFLISRCFNSVTCENSFKPVCCFNPTSPSLFAINPAAVDVLSFAKKNNLKIRMHVLVWYKYIDMRIFCRNYECEYEDEAGISEKHMLTDRCLVSREELLDRLQRYINGAVEYVYSHGYAAGVSGWDVLNEAVSSRQDRLLRDCLWLRIIGPEYVYYSFRFARDAVTRCAEKYADLYEPKQRPLLTGKLFYNDNREWETGKQEKILRMLAEEHFLPGHGTILSEGLVDGIGMQCHVSTALDLDAYMAVLKKYRRVFDLVHITEMDVIPEKNSRYTPAEMYETMIGRFREAAQQGMGPASVTVWGLTDDRSWLKDKKCSLMFDASCRRKEEFAAVVKSLAKG